MLATSVRESHTSHPTCLFPGGIQSSNVESLMSKISSGLWGKEEMERKLSHMTLLCASIFANTHDKPQEQPQHLAWHLSRWLSVSWAGVLASAESQMQCNKPHADGCAGQGISRHASPGNILLFSGFPEVLEAAFS